MDTRTIRTRKSFTALEVREISRLFLYSQTQIIDLAREFKCSTSMINKIIDEELLVRSKFKKARKENREKHIIKRKIY